MKRGEMRADWIMESVFMNGLWSGFGGFFEPKENREVLAKIESSLPLVRSLLATIKSRYSGV
jgi:hypothetical protein